MEKWKSYKKTRTVSMVKGMRLSAVLAVSVLCVGGIICMCCKFSGSDDTTTYEAPQVESSSTGMVISMEPVSGTSYINVYRRTVSSGAYSDYISIGQIDLNGSGKSWPATVTFPDPYALSGVSYQYRARYYANGYKVTAWSVTVDGQVSVTGTVVYTVDSAATLVYSSDYKTLTVSGTITAPTSITSVEPKIALATSSVSSLFDVSSVADASEIHLTDILPSSYYDTSVSVTGIVGEIKSVSADSNYIRYYWTAPASVTMTDGTNTITSFTIASASSSTGNDYSSPSQSVRTLLPAAVSSDYSK